MTNNYPPPPVCRGHIAMSARLIAAVFAGFMFITPCSAQMSKEDAFEAGKQAGRDSTPDYDQIFSEQNTQSTVPHEQGSEEHSKFWSDTGSKITDMVVEGVNLLAVCMSGAEGPGDQLRCEAVRMLMGNHEKKGVKEELAKKEDPMFQIRDAIMKNPEAMAGAWGGEYTDCQEFSLGGGTEFDYETCTEVASVAGEDEQFCTLGRTIVIDPKLLYQCTRTMSQINSGQCVLGERVTIDRNSLYQCGFFPRVSVTESCEALLEAKCTNCSDANKNLRCSLDAGVVLDESEHVSITRTPNSGSDAYGPTNSVSHNFVSGEYFFALGSARPVVTTLWTRNVFIKNLAELQEFRVIYAYVDIYYDTGYFEVNGTRVINFPGNRGRYEWSLSTDLLPYLREGNNTFVMQMYHPYSSYGSILRLWFRTYFICEPWRPVWRDDWDDRCLAHGTILQPAVPSTP